MKLDVLVNIKIFMDRRYECKISLLRETFREVGKNLWERGRIIERERERGEDGKEYGIRS